MSGIRTRSATKEGVQESPGKLTRVCFRTWKRIQRSRQTTVESSAVVTKSEEVYFLVDENSTQGRRGFRSSEA